MKDPRFLPVENREPVEEYDDDFLENEEELYEALYSSRKDKATVKKIQLYIAS
tara:strand:- start:35471 stop:35629 length:159 start_codon:yes stop_codon:yes gene_type:complete